MYLVLKEWKKLLDYILLGGFLGIFMCVIILIMFSNGFIGIVIRTSILGYYIFMAQ